MSKMSVDNGQCMFKYERLDEGIPEDDCSRFIVRFMDMFYPVLNIEKKLEKKGCPAYPPREMFKLVIYAFYRGLTNIELLSENARYHQIYKYVCGNIQPSGRTIRRFIQKYGHYFKILLSCTLLFANEVNLTEFEHVSADGTFKKANNNRYNVIHKDDLEILLDYYENKSFDTERLSKLRRPASRFLLKENISNEEKIELLYDMKTQLTMSGQNTIPVNDIEARWMRNKDGISQISYNIQSAVDTTTKLICAVNVSQSPTDHYELPNIVKTTIENINKKPEKISADTGYHNPVSIEYLAKNNIQGLIPDRKQTHEIKKQTNTNPFHKDHFKYDYTNDTYICPQNQRLFFKYKYTYPSKDKNKPNKVERKYMNYDACKNCKSLHQCTKSSHRIISEFANENTLQMKEYMDTPEAQNEYKKRSSTVEAPFGTLKIFYEFNKLRTNGITQTENIMNLISTSYNLKRLYNIQNNILDEITEIDNFLEKLSTIFNLQLTATIK